jgi:protoporphyrinogen oxidase
MRVAIVGGGITGLSVADTLTQHGVQCTVFERDADLGGLAGSFRVNDVYLEKFYHHLYTSDQAMVALIERLGLGERFEWLPTNNSYYAGRFFRLSTPLDLLRFSHINLWARIRLGIFTLRTRFIGDWQPLEGVTAKDWLIRMAGQQVYHAVWEPMLRAKFGRYADEVAAVWIWNKVKLRGSSRGKTQEEQRGYLRGGFGQALDAWVADLAARGVELRAGTPVERVIIRDGRAVAVQVNGQEEAFDQVIVTVAPQVFAGLAPDLPQSYLDTLARIDYLANVCLVMELDRSLSDTYWLNIGDPTIPFTAVIEHTNMQRSEDYGGAHLTYISRYLDADDPAMPCPPTNFWIAICPIWSACSPALAAIGSATCGPGASATPSRSSACTTRNSSRRSRRRWTACG